MSDLFGQIQAVSDRGDTRRSKVTRKRWFTTLVAVGCLAAVTALGIGTYHTLVDGFSNPFAKPPPADYASGVDAEPGTPVQIQIPEGATGAKMAKVLAESGVVASAEAFTNAFMETPDAAKIQPGTYQIATHLSAGDAIAALLVAEKIETKVTFPEGFTVVQIVDRMEAQLNFPRESIEAALADPAALSLPAEAGGNFEGWLFPATYTIQPSDTAETLLTAMISKTVTELTDLGVAPADWERTLIVASLIEREVKAPEDRPMMARAIQNRLDRPMRLDIDATVAYGLGINGTDLTLDDIADSSNPYNTYRHDGLPPGPISNPGASAVEAVLNPADGDWLFWTAVNLDTGETKFAATNKEHEANVAELRAWQEANGR